MSEWLIQTYEDGTISVGERNLPDPKIPQYEFESLQDLNDTCDANIDEILQEWYSMPGNEGRDLVKYEIDETLPENIKREFENWNNEVDFYNGRIQRWQDLKDAAVAE